MSSISSFLLSRYGTGLLLAGLVGCTAGSLEEQALRAYVQDPAHGLIQPRTVGAVQAVCAYRPTGLLVAQDLDHTPGTASATLADSLRRAYAGKSYFSLSLAQNGAEIENQFIANQTAFTDALTYLNTGIAQDVFLVTAAQDSVPALASIYPRQYGATGQSTVLLIFDTHQLLLTQDFHLTFRDTRFNLGTLRFPFAGSAIAAVPELKVP